MTSLSTNEPSYLKRSAQFLFDYFLNSDDKSKKWLLLTGTVLGVLSISALNVVLGWWCFPSIYSAFIAKDVVPLLFSLGSGFLIMAAMSGLNFLTNHLKNSLYVNWRSWLTKKLTNQYLKNKTNYLEISRLYEDIDNPEQRIQEDINNVVESSLELSMGFINNLTNLVTYTVLLCFAGSSLSFIFFGMNIVIPGFLVWMALLVGIGTSLIGYFINRSLQKSTNEETISQSDLRADLQQIKTFSEEIAIEHAEQYYQNRIEKRVDELNDKTSKRLSIQNGTTSFNIFTGILHDFVPFMAAGPIYFADLMTIETFFSVGYYFSMITRSLTWFIESFEKINKFKTSLSRVIGLQQILDKKNDGSSQQNISRMIQQHDQRLLVKGLDLKMPGTNQLVVKGLNLEFTPGVHTLIQAPSGTGKSSLFKAIAGTWLSGEGEIVIPHSFETIYFLPQRPTLPHDTLRKVLAYPEAQCNYSDEELIWALNAVNLDGLTSKLDKTIGFKSLGEQQRIAFARVLLRKPQWVFLDEATASLDEDVESKVYSQLKKLLPNVTFVSIAHRSTVRSHHDRVLFFNANDKKEIVITEEYSKCSSY